MTELVEHDNFFPFLILDIEAFSDLSGLYSVKVLMMMMHLREFSTFICLYLNVN